MVLVTPAPGFSNQSSSNQTPPIGETRLQNWDFVSQYTYSNGGEHSESSFKDLGRYHDHDPEWHGFSHEAQTGIGDFEPKLSSNDEFVQVRRTSTLPVFSASTFQPSESVGYNDLFSPKVTRSSDLESATNEPCDVSCVLNSADDYAAFSLLDLSANHVCHPEERVIWNEPDLSTDYAPVYMDDAPTGFNTIAPVDHSISSNQIDPALLEAAKGSHDANDDAGACMSLVGGLLAEVDRLHSPEPTGQKLKRRRSVADAEPQVVGPVEIEDMTGEGRYRVDVLHHPADVTGFDPEPYRGPAATPLCDYQVYTGIGVADYVVYQPLRNWNGFSYDSRGYLDLDYKFDAARLKSFITEHPLGKNLLLRLEKIPGGCKNRYENERNNVCRAQYCLESEDGRLTQGQLRVAIEEVWGRTPRRHITTSDPFFAAGYFHLSCFETLVDIGQLLRLGMFRTFPRMTFNKEPRANKNELNRFCFSNHLDMCVKLFAKKIIKEPNWTGYKTNVLDMLSTRVWLRGTRNKPFNLSIPPQLPADHAERLHANKKPAPGWGGQRFPGIKSQDADRLVATGKGNIIGSKAQDRRNSYAQILLEEQRRQKEEQFTDAQEWLEEVHGCHSSAKRLVSERKVRRPAKRPRRV
jgi:hypothetical protein